MEYFDGRNTGSDNFAFYSEEEYPYTGTKILRGLARLIRKINESGETC